MNSIILNNAMLDFPNEGRHGHIVVRDGLIAEVGDGQTRAAGAIDCDATKSSRV